VKKKAKYSPRISNTLAPSVHDCESLTAFRRMVTSKLTGFSQSAFTTLGDPAANVPWFLAKVGTV